MQCLISPSWTDTLLPVSARVPHIKIQTIKHTEINKKNFEKNDLCGLICGLYCAKEPHQQVWPLHRGTTGRNQVHGCLVRMLDSPGPSLVALNVHEIRSRFVEAVFIYLFFLLCYWYCRQTYTTFCLFLCWIMNAGYSCCQNEDRRCRFSRLLVCLIVLNDDKRYLERIVCFDPGNMYMTPAYNGTT